MNFNKIVKESLESTLNLFEFILIEESNGYLRYEGKLLLITLFYDFKKSYEVDVTFSYKGSQSYTFSELKEYFFNEKDKLIATQILEENKMKTWLQEVNTFLIGHIDGLTKNHKKISKDLNKLIQKKANDYEIEQKTKHLKQNIDKYWRDKDYSSLVNFVEKSINKIEFENFSKVYQKKYELAKKMNEDDSNKNL